jgi:glycosyltransferase involved in cell wall biosynthesis
MYKNKINLALLANTYGGNATSVNDLIVRLDKNRFNPIFIFLTGSKFPENHFQQAGYKVIYLSNGNHVATFSPFAIFKLAKALKENRIDILHCHCHKTTVIGTSAAMLAGIPVVFTFVRGLNRTRTLLRRFTNFFLFEKVNKILPVSQSVKDDVLKSNWSVEADKLFVLENSIDYERFANADITKLKAKQLLGFSENDFLFGTVGRLVPTKGLPYLLDAFAKVKNTIPNAHLVLIGDGYARTELENYAAKTGCASSVHFLGRKDNIEKLLKGFDVFVLASIAEGMPRAVLEAMAAGVPCIATKVGGLLEIIESSDTGILVPPRNFDSLAEAMKTLANMSAEGLEKIVKNAQNRVREIYSHEVVAEKLQNLYEAEFQKHISR